MITKSSEKQGRITLFFLNVFLTIVSLQVLLAQVPLPKISDPVSDYTNTLSRDQYENLRRQVLLFEDSTSNQIAVLMIPTTGEDDIRDFGIKTLEQNKIGQKGKDNGVLLLIAKDDHKVSIEVGYGLEGVLTDALCSEIIRDEILPSFRQDDYYGGIATAIHSIMLASRGEYKGSGRQRNQSNWFSVLVLFIFIMSFASLFGRRRRYGMSSRGANSIWWWGGGLGGGGGGNWGSFGGGGGGGGWSAGGGSFGGGGASGGW